MKFFEKELKKINEIKKYKYIKEKKNFRQDTADILDEYKIINEIFDKKEYSLDEKEYSIEDIKDKLKSIENIFKNKEIKSDFEHMKNDYEDNSINETIYFNQNDFLRDMKKYKNRNNDDLKHEIDEIYAQICIYDKKIEEIKKNLESEFTKEKSEYLEKNKIRKIEELKTLEEGKNKYEDIFREKVIEFTDNIEEKNYISKNMYNFIQNLMK